jgi:hypothetical protein
MTKIPQKPISEGNTRGNVKGGNVKGGVQKPGKTTLQKPKGPPPAPKPKK